MTKGVNWTFSYKWQLLPFHLTNFMLLHRNVPLMVLFQNCSKTYILCRTFVAAASEIEKNTQTLKTFISIIHLSDSKIIWQKYSLSDSLQKLFKPYWFCWQTGQSGIRKGVKWQNFIIPFLLNFLLDFKIQMAFTDKLFLSLSVHSFQFHLNSW